MSRALRLLLASSLLAVPLAAGEVPAAGEPAAGEPAAGEPAAGEPAAEEPAGLLFVVHYRAGPSWDAAKPFAEQRHAADHSAHLRALREAGTLVLGARYGDAGMVVLRATSETAAREAVTRDPAVAAGVFTVTVDRFVPFMDGCVAH